MVAHEYFDSTGISGVQYYDSLQREVWLVAMERATPWSLGQMPPLPRFLSLPTFEWRACVAHELKFCLDWLPTKIQAPCNIWDIFILKYYLLIWNSNLMGLLFLPQIWQPYLEHFFHSTYTVLSCLCIDPTHTLHTHPKINLLLLRGRLDSYLFLYLPLIHCFKFCKHSINIFDWKILVWWEPRRETLSIWNWWSQNLFTMV